MATTVPPAQNRRASSRPDGAERPGRQRHDEHRHRALVSDTLVSLRDRGVKRFTRAAGPLDTARHMLDRMRAR